MSAANPEVQPFDPVQLSKERANIGSAVFDEFMEGGAATELSPQDSSQGYKDMLGYLESRPHADTKGSFHDPKTGNYMSHEDASAVYAPERGDDVDEYESMTVSQLARKSAEAEMNADKTTMASVDDALQEKLLGMNLSDSALNSDGSKRENSEQDQMFDRVMKLREKYIAEMKAKDNKSAFPEVKDMQDGETVKEVFADEDAHPEYKGPVTPGMELVVIEKPEAEGKLPWRERATANIKNRWTALKLGKFGEALFPEKRKGKIALAVGAVALAYGVYRLQRDGLDALPFIGDGGDSPSGNLDAQSHVGAGGAAGHLDTSVDPADIKFMNNAPDAIDPADIKFTEATNHNTGAGDTLKDALTGGGDQGGGESVVEIPSHTPNHAPDVSDFTSNVADVVAPGHEVEAMNSAIGQYNDIHNTNFALTPHEGSTWIMDGGRAVNQAQMEEINQILIDLSKELATA